MTKLVINDSLKPVIGTPLISLIVMCLLGLALWAALFWWLLR